MDKSVKAVFLGVVVGLLWAVISGFLIAAIVGSSAESPISPTFFLAVLGGGLIGSFASGWATAKRAPHSPLSHALASGVVNGLLGMGSAMPTEVRQLQFLAAVALALFGGWARSIKAAASTS